MWYYEIKFDFTLGDKCLLTTCPGLMIISPLEARGNSRLESTNASNPWKPDNLTFSSNAFGKFKSGLGRVGLLCLRSQGSLVHFFAICLQGVYKAGNSEVIRFQIKKNRLFYKSVVILHKSNYMNINFYLKRINYRRFHHKIGMCIQDKV